MSRSCRIEQIWVWLSDPNSLRTWCQGLALAPRLILHVASVAALAGMFAACVPTSRYEAAKSASELELAGRMRAEAELQATRSQLADVTAELNRREQNLLASEQSVSASKFENTLAVKERDEATGLVEQLRGELARVGDNLRSYAQQKAELEKSLQAVQTRKQELESREQHLQAMVRLTRDLTTALGDRVLSGDVLIDVQDGRVVLSAAPELWFDDAGNVRAGMDGVLASVNRVLTLHEGSTLELSLPNAEPAQRGAALLRALTSRGVAASRFNLKATELLPGADVAPLATAAPMVVLSFKVG